MGARFFNWTVLSGFGDTVSLVLGYVGVVVFSIFTADIIVSLIYVILNKSRITTSLAVSTNVRVIIAFLIMLVTMFFYAFALWRVDQFSAPMQITLFIGGAIVYLAVFNSTKTMLTNQD